MSRSCVFLLAALAGGSISTPARVSPVLAIGAVIPATSASVPGAFGADAEGVSADPNPLPSIPPSWSAVTVPTWELVLGDHDCAFDVEFIELGNAQLHSESSSGSSGVTLVDPQSAPGVWRISQHVSAQDGYFPLYYGTGLSNSAQIVQRDTIVSDHLKVRITLLDCDGKVHTRAYPEGKVIAHSRGLSAAGHQVQVRVDSQLTDLLVREETPWQVTSFRSGPTMGAGGSFSVAGVGGGASISGQPILGGGTISALLSNASPVREDERNIIENWTEEFEVWVAQRNHFWARGSTMAVEGPSIGRGFIAHWQPDISVRVFGGPNLADWFLVKWTLDD